MTPPHLPDALRADAQGLLASGGRRILGLVGAPGSGKSTLASLLEGVLGPEAVVVPMDGFHLANAELRRLGRADRKGAPDTFDAAGFCALLGRLRTASAGETVYAPAFHRDIEEAVAGSIAVPSEVPLVIVEGNYLLLDGDWSPVRPSLDASWYLDTPDPIREGWLRDRHMAFGRSAEEARAWIEHTDAPNARTIAATRARATRIVKWPDRCGFPQP